MKNIFKLVLLFLVSSSFFISCKKDKSLSELRHEERVAIQKYIEDNLTEEIISNNPEKGSKLLMDYDKDSDKIIFKVEQKKKTKKKE